MKEKERFTEVLMKTMAIVTTIFLSFGLLGYLAFQEDTKGIVTLNLPDGAMTTCVKLLLCVGLLFTFPIMLFPVSQAHCFRELSC